MGKTEPEVKSMSKKEFNERIRLKPPQLANPLFLKIQNVLDYKKQVILYGPPGTGKTWIASNFIKSKNTSGNKKKTIRSNKKFFLYNVVSDNWPELDDFLKKQEIIDDLGVDSESRSYEEIEKGDIVLINDVGENGRLIGIASCAEKYPPSENGTGVIDIRGIKSIQGPLWKTIEEDPILHNSLPVKYNASSSRKPRVVPSGLHPQQELLNLLFPLTQEEAVQLLELSQVSLKDLNISVVEKTKPNISNFNEEDTDETNLCNFITFHPSYAYEEFIEGLRPNADDGGDIRYEIQEGIFKRASREALNALLEVAEIDQEWQDQFPVPTFSSEDIEKIRGVVDRIPCFLVIDEINRGDISRIFGELITLVESDKRLFSDNEIRCKLPYSKMEFGIPPNLFIIGTMNTADRSISLMDIALRRRFGFIELLPDYDALTKILINDSNPSEDVKEYRRLAIQSLKTVNERLTEKYDRDHQIGHSYLMKLSQDTSIEDTKETLTNIWKYEIIPLLQEYFYDSPEKLLYVTNNRFFEKSGSSFVLKTDGDIIESLRTVIATK